MRFVPKKCWTVNLAQYLFDFMSLQQAQSRFNDNAELASALEATHTKLRPPKPHYTQLWASPETVRLKVIQRGFN